MNICSTESDPSCGSVPRKSKKLTVGSLFAGIGGLDLGLERSGGFEIAWQVEIDPYCQKVLAKHWPDVPRYGDIRECGEGRTHALPPVDVLCGGFPCQPHSLAGRRKAGADERDLWPEFSRLIRELRPAWVLAENVPGLRTSDAGRFFGGILRDLAEIGYDAEWTVLSAAQFGAPHQRERIFIVAYPVRSQRRTYPQRGQDVSHGDDSRWQETAGGFALRRETLAYPARYRLLSAWQSNRHDGDACQRDQALADPAEQGLPFGGCARLTASDTQGRAGVEHQPQRCNETLGNAHYAGRQERDAPAKPGREGLPAWGDAENGSLWQPEPRLGGMLTGLPSRLDGYRWPARPGESQAAWEPPRVVTEKKINRVARLKALGNAIVPQCAEYIAHCILAALQEDEEVAG